MNPKITSALAALLTGILISITAHATPPPAPKTWTDPASGIEFVRVDKACYSQGNATAIPPEADGGWRRMKYTQSLSHDEGPEHEVCLDPYWLGRYEVTRGQWLKVMGNLPDGDRTMPANRPVTRVTWTQANAFAKKLTDATKGRFRFRLPTEAEWEFACRGGHPDTLDRDPPRHEDDLAKIAVAAVEALRPPEPVGTRMANSAGLFDMLGNVWEWVADDYAPDAYSMHDLYNPRHKNGGDVAVMRGGSLRTEFAQARCTMRGRYEKEYTLDLIGLRIARED